MPTIPATMKAVLLKGHGGFEQLEYRDDVPVPRPGPGEVLIRVAAAGVNNTDINTRTGWYAKSVTGGTPADGGPARDPRAEAEAAGWTGAPLAFPRIQGADACGRIVVVGAGVDPARMGERVLIEPGLREPAGGRVRYLGSECDGGFAEYTKVPAVNAHRVDCALSDPELASFPCAYSAAENMLTRADLRAGETVLITGGSGGVGSAAVQLAKRRGATVVAVAGAAKAEPVKRLGADAVLPRGSSVIDALGQDAVHVVVDVVGGPRWPELLDVMRPGGRYAVAGAIAGPLVTLDLRTLYLKDLRLLGCTTLEPDVFGRLVGYIERGEIKPVVASTYPLKDIVRAQQEFLAKDFTGKIVLIP
jgi:NADPH:quinone reductase-like Zn-dependent oxidoreductase